MGHEIYVKCKFYVYVSTDATADQYWFQLEICILHIDIRKERTENLNWYKALFK